MSPDGRLTADVWCGKWLFPKRGTLTLSGRRLVFEMRGQPVFDVTLDRIERLTWHWHSFSAAFEAEIGGRSWFLSFVRPGNALFNWWREFQRGRLWRSEIEARRNGAPVV